MSGATSKRVREEEWHDYCAECKRSGGALLCCDGCPRSYHLTCAHLRSMPVGEWFCPHCSSDVGARESASAPPNVLVPSAATTAASTPATGPTSADSASEASTKVPSSSTVPAGAVPAAIAVPSPTPSPTDDRGHALLQTSQELRTLAAAELAHARSEITKADTRLSEARDTVARLEAERATLVQRSEQLGTILNNLTAISATVDATPPQALPPPLERQPVAGGANSPAPASCTAPLPAPTKAVSPPNKSGGLTFGRELSRPGRARTVALWNPACLRHTPQASCPEQPTRLRAVVSVLEEISADHPSLLALTSSSSEVDSRYVSAVHAPEYITMLESSQPRGWEPPMRLGAARATIGTSGLAWSADGERRSLREHKDPADYARIKHAGGGAPVGTFAPSSALAEQPLEPGHDLDTFLSAGSMVAARHAAGAVCEAIDHVLRGVCRNAFVAARPPGHHAGVGGVAMDAPSQGFCLLNHVAIGCRYALRTHANLARIAILDFDVHHGNGTQEIFDGDPAVLFLSVHVHDKCQPFFPATGSIRCQPCVDEVVDGDGQGSDNGGGGNGSNGGGNIVNTPLPRGADRLAFSQACAPILQRLRSWRPELILLSAGFDAHADDPLGGSEAEGLSLTEDDFALLTEQIVEVAEATCQGRIVSVLEGGYNPAVLRRCVGAHVKALMGVRRKSPAPAT